MSCGSEGPRDGAGERSTHILNKGLESFFRDLEPILKGFAELGELVRPFAESMERLAAAAAPFVQTVAHGMKRWEIAEGLMARGWVPSSTTPFDLVEDCGNDTAGLQEALLAYYSNNWRNVRARLEASVGSRDIDDKAKAVFREALDAHEHGLYRCVSRLLFLEFERVLGKVLLNEEAGRIKHRRLARKLADESGQLPISGVLSSGIHGMVMFRYLTEGTRIPRTPADRSKRPAPGFRPGLYVHVNKANLDHARQSPVPTRHAVAHGLADYSSQQNSLNALFIADYVFLISSELSRKKAEGAAQAA